MAQKDLLKKFSDILLDNSAFYCNVQAYGKQTSEYLETVIKMKEANYKLDQKEYNRLINLLTYKKTNSIFTNLQRHKQIYDYNTRQYSDNPNYVLLLEILKYMFDCHLPNDSQMNILIYCTRGFENKQDNWVDYLIERKYVFSAQVMSNLTVKGYDTSKIMVDKNISIEDLEILLKNPIGLTQLQTIIEKNNIVPTTECVINHMENKSWLSTGDCSLLNLLIEKGAIITEECIQAYIKFANAYWNAISFEPLKILCKGLNKPVSNDLVLFLINCTTFKFDILVYLLENYELELSSDILNNSISKGSLYSNNIQESFPELWNKYSNNYSFNKIEYLLDKGIPPNGATLELICKNRDNNNYYNLVKNYNMLPNKQCLDITLRYFDLRSNFEIVQDILSFKVLPDEISVKSVISNSINEDISIKLIELLINFGLVVTLPIVQECLIAGITIPDLERFNIKYDDELYHTCFFQDFFPQEYIDKFTINKDQLQLRTLCGTPNTQFADVEKFIQEHNVKLDRYSFDNACKKNISLALDFLNNGAKPSIYSSFFRNKPSMDEIDRQIFKALEKEHNIDYLYMNKLIN